MRSCNNCGQLVQDGAAFCLNCGQPCRTAPSGSFSSRQVLPVVLGFLIVSGFAWSFAASGLLQAKGKAGSNAGSLSASSKPGAPSLLVPQSANGTPKVAFAGENGSPGGLELPAQPSADPSVAIGANPDSPVIAEGNGKLPDDITDWLRHLKRCDQRREEIDKTGSADLKQGIEDLSSSTETTPEGLEGYLSGRENQVDDDYVSKLSEEFRLLRSLFLSKRPPAPCQSIATNYDKVLLETQKCFQEISNAMRSLDFESLLTMVGSSYDRIDRSVAAANRDIQRLCDTYGVENKYKLLVDPAQNFSGAVGMGGNDLKKLKKQYDDLLGGGDDGGGN